MISKGYVGVFDAPLTRAVVEAVVDTWLGSNFKIEQVCPGPHAGNVTIAITKTEELLWEDNLQFRVLSDVTFAWVYFSLNRCVMETSGLPDDGNLMPLEVLADLPGIVEVVDQVNERRLEQLEAEGLM
jgi:hypothetical protein